MRNRNSPLVPLTLVILCSLIRSGEPRADMSPPPRPPPPPSPRPPPPQPPPRPPRSPMLLNNKPLDIPGFSLDLPAAVDTRRFYLNNVHVSRKCAPVHGAFERVAASGLNRTLVIRDIHPGAKLPDILEYRAYVILAGLMSNRMVLFEHCQEPGQLPWSDRYRGSVSACDAQGLNTTGGWFGEGVVPPDVSQSYVPVHGPTLQGLREQLSIFPPADAPVVSGQMDGEEQFKELLMSEEPTIVVENPDPLVLYHMVDHPALVEVLGRRLVDLRRLYDVPELDPLRPDLVKDRLLPQLSCCALQAYHWAPTGLLALRFRQRLRELELEAAPPVMMYVRTAGPRGADPCSLNETVFDWDEMDSYVAGCEAREVKWTRHGILRGSHSKEYFRTHNHHYAQVWEAAAGLTFGRPIVAVAEGWPLHAFFELGYAGNPDSYTRGSPFVTSGPHHSDATLEFGYTFKELLDLHLLAQTEYIVAPHDSSAISMAQCLSHREHPPVQLRGRFDFEVLEAEGYLRHGTWTPSPLPTHTHGKGRDYVRETYDVMHANFLLHGVAPMSQAAEQAAFWQAYGDKPAGYVGGNSSGGAVPRGEHAPRSRMAHEGQGGWGEHISERRSYTRCRSRHWCLDDGRIEKDIMSIDLSTRAIEAWGEEQTVPGDEKTAGGTEEATEEVTEEPQQTTEEGTSESAEQGGAAEEAVVADTAMRAPAEEPRREWEEGQAEEGEERGPAQEPLSGRPEDFRPNYGDFLGER